MSTKERIYQITYDVRQPLQVLPALERQLEALEKTNRKLFKGSFAPLSRNISQLAKAATAAQKATAKGSERTKRMLGQELSARKNLDSALTRYRKNVKASERDAVRAGKNIERIVKADERATRRLAKETERAAKAALRARKQFKGAILGIGRSSRSGFAAMAQHAAAATLAYVSLYKVLQKIGEAKDRYMRFDELTTATMTMTHAGEAAFEHGSKGAERYRDAVREAANEVKTTAAEMSDSALFWAKAGQTNAATITELSKVGTMFARANRDAANNVLDQARANDILSDALQLFRKDTSTTEKAVEAATSLGDKLTTAANSSNIVVEQLFDYSKKVGALFKTGEVADEEIMAIAASLASAGLKEESGVHVRRILTQLSEGSVQKLLKGVGIDVANEDGSIRSFGKIFGELQETLKGQKPLERMDFLRDLFGQRAVATAAAMAGINEKGSPAATSINAILEKLAKAEGIAKRNQEQYLNTTGGRVKALTSTWGNALDKMLEDSGIIQKILSGFEDIDPEEAFAWLNDTVVPAMEALGVTIRDTLIPGVQMAGKNLSEWFAPALSIVSGLLGSTNSNAEGLSDTITTLVKLWVKWRIGLLAIKGLRMADWFVQFAAKARAAAAATATIGTTTTKSVTAAKTAVSGLPMAFSAAGVGIAAAIAAWGLYDLLVGPVRDAEKRIAEFKIKHGEKFERLDVGEEDHTTLSGRIRDAEKSHRMYVSSISAESMNDPAVQALIQAGENEITRLREIQAAGAIKDFGPGSRTSIKGRYAGGKSEFDPTADLVPGGRTSVSLDAARAAWHTARNQDDASTLSQTQKVLEGALNEQLDTYQGEQAKLGQKQDKILEAFVQAAGAERDELHKQLGAVADQMKENADAINGYTSDLDEIAGNMAENREKERVADVAEAVKEERKQQRRGAFKGGGKSEPLNPFATPLMTGIDKAGNRIINLALQKGNAAEYYRKSPEARAQLERNLKADQKVVNINFGDQSISVTSKSDADPHAIAKLVKDEAYKMDERKLRDVERFLSVTAPGEI